MVSADSFWTSSLRNSPKGESITRILAAAIQAAEPGRAVKRCLQRDGTHLFVSGKAYNLQEFKRVFLLGIGKAAAAMTGAALEILGDRVTSGLVVTKQAPASALDQKIEVLLGGHPLPDAGSLRAGKEVLEQVGSLNEEDLLICLISGGGSALVSAPEDGISLKDMQALTAALIACGAPIGEINILRRHLDRVKGGGIVRSAKNARVISLIISDVVGNPLEAIASGPTASDPTTRNNAQKVLEKYELTDRLPAAIIHALEVGPETLKPGEAVFQRVQNVLAASSLQAAQAGLQQATEEGFNPYLLRTDLQGNAQVAAFELATALRQAKRSHSPAPVPACLLAAGETTVVLKGNGQGGRNTELALAAVTELADFPEVMLVTLASDGEDGPTDAAGAVVTGETYRRAIRMGLQPGEYLQRNDSYSFFATLDDLLKPGSTGTNVNDLIFLFTF